MIVFLGRLSNKYDSEMEVDENGKYGRIMCSLNYETEHHPAYLLGLECNGSTHLLVQLLTLPSPLLISSTTPNGM